MPSEKANSRRSFIRTVTGAGALLYSGVLPAASIQAPQERANDTGPVILFQGDSITDGNRSRNNDWNHLLGHGYAYLVASKLGFEHPDKNFHFYNRGISGNKVTDLAARWQTDTIDIKPDVLSILIGVNDVNSMFTGKDMVTAERFGEVYRSLLNQTKEKLPGVHLVLCEPFILRVGRVQDKWEEWFSEIQKRQEIVQKLSVEYHTVYVPLQEAFNKAVDRAPAGYWIWDGVHPMPAGHELIAREWISITKKHIHIF